jgi:ABC-type multidrug transport system fused ATPase/permease subunit
LRSIYIKRLLTQEIGFFESINVEQLPTLIGDNFQIVSNSIGEKFSNILLAIFTFIAGIVIAFVYGPSFAAVCFGFFPLMFTAMVFFGSNVRKAAL